MLVSLDSFLRSCPSMNANNHLISSYFHLLHSAPTPRHLRHLHGRLIRLGLHSNVILSTKLLLAYSDPHRLIRSSLSLFLHHMPHRNSFSWNSILSQLSRSALPLECLRIFLSMRSRGLRVDEFTLPPVLRSCASAGAAGTGASVHGLSARLGLDGNPFVASALVFFYVGVSSISHARKVFDEIPHRDSVLWTSMVSGYAQSGEPELALGVFREMLRDGARIDDVVAVSLLLACGQLSSLRQGRSVHGLCVRRNFGLPLSLGNALVDMYVKCGAFGSAERVFTSMAVKDVISWTALVLGHGLNGRADAALKLFEKMLEAGVMPNSVTFLGVLSACVHSGMVERAWELFHLMKQCKVEPELKHYACIVDGLGRSGRVAEAEKFMEEMPMEPDEAVLGALLFGCRVHGNIDVGARVARRLMAMRPDKSGYYAILANMYSDAGRFEDADRVRSFMRKMNVDKLPGRSLIESDGFWERAFQ